jgi:hypothetical protein
MPITRITDSRSLGIKRGNDIKFNDAVTFPLAAYTPTNVTTDRAYNANSTDVAELADVLGTLIADLQAQGLIG